MKKLYAYLIPVLITFLMLACAPSYWGDNPNGTPQPVEIRADWQCSTPSPVPTVTILAGEWPTPERPPDWPTTTPWEPTAEPRIEHTTPVPTATYYVKGGSDFYQGQQISINNQLRLTVIGYTSTAARQAGQAYHRITLEIDNQTGKPLGVFFDLSQIRTIKGTDNRIIAGEWYHEPTAAQALGISPSSDPDVEINDVGNVIGGYPTGKTTRELVFPGPAGAAQMWGISLVDGGNTSRDGGVGQGQIWVLLKQDPYCANSGGAPIAPVVPGPAGTPVAGPGSWPVLLDTVISRGYGCHVFFTGVRGNCPFGMWWHDGIDFASYKGAPLFATRSLAISYAGQDYSTIDCSTMDGSDPPHSGFGQYVRGEDSQGYVYWYGHLSAWRVSAGQRVNAGDQIANMGSTGCSTGAHLHFRVRLNGLDINPMDVISK